jgi:hypothetical protein
MENQENQGFLFKKESTYEPTSSSIFSNNNIIITILVFLLVLSFLGINLLTIVGNFLQTLSNIFAPFFLNILSFLGYSTGTILNKTTDVLSNTAITGIQITDSAIKNVGNLLKESSQGNIDTTSKNALDNAINSQTPPVSPPRPPEPTPSENPIQKPITSNKTSWCLVGEYKEKRGCIEIGESDKCLSGQIYPNQQMCLNPTLSPNV